VFINPKDGLEMVLVPAGSFLYGSKEDDPNARSDEKPQRVIDLPSFYIDRYPVTNEQYCRFLNETKPDNGLLSKYIDLKGSLEKQRCRIREEGNKFGIEKGYERHLVIYVTWDGADAYAKWAGKKLPSEQEWEKAARGTDGRRSPGVTSSIRINVILLSRALETQALSTNIPRVQANTGVSTWQGMSGSGPIAVMKKRKEPGCPVAAPGTTLGTLRGVRAAGAFPL
jgi:Sulfatase-modifying factor enzyme 1